MKNNSKSLDNRYRFKWDSIIELTEEFKFHYSKPTSVINGYAYRDGIFIMTTG
jgi:hypothetical protein